MSTRHARGRPTPAEVAAATGRPPCSEALAGWRLANGWSQSGLADALGLPRSVVKRAEGGDLGASDHMAQRRRNWRRVKAALPAAVCPIIRAREAVLRLDRQLCDERAEREHYRSLWIAECQTSTMASAELREARADIASMRETLRAALKSRDALRRSAPDLVATIATTSHGWSLTTNGRGYIVEARLPLSDDEAHRLMREGREAFEDMCSISDEREVFEVGVVGDEVGS